MTIRQGSMLGLMVLGCVVGLAACGSQQHDADAAPAPQVAASCVPAGAPPLPPDLLNLGTQEARDDLYCSALIYEENPDVSDALAPVDEALLRKAQSLGFVIGERGINLLVEQKAAHATHARAIADAYDDLIAKDVKVGKPRISLDECNVRAAAIKVPE